ncbi:hypothetical protein [uncultured Oscillibacter sp.]|uniref:hypothetical protein n=1 Tax=uncultured Oscillibacter sp. TaxID=876091 RepID=UPI0025F581FF|nr:hypothetical protein [uncultured Oscillibacter sp.]
MYNILEAIYYDEPLGLRGKSPLEPPLTAAETRVLSHLQALPPREAEVLSRELRAMAMEQRNTAFSAGTRFGAQLMLQLAEDF